MICLVHFHYFIRNHDFGICIASLRNQLVPSPALKYPNLNSNKKFLCHL